LVKLSIIFVLAVCYTMHFDMKTNGCIERFNMIAIMILTQLIVCDAK